nr:MAG TPA: hypothetical protein [Caudoviricetes sp.]
MASKTQKVITPENLGQGIAYNPQTKKWEVHFVSEAEIEQVANYVEPQEDDEHYVAKECVKLRDRASGYMWDSCKSTLKDRAPARDEEATINAEIVPGNTPYIRIFDVTSNIDGTGVTGNYEYEQDLSRFNTTKEYNDFIKGKKIKLVTNKRFADSSGGKPMIRSTTLEASYPVMQDRVEERTWSFTNADGYLDVYSGDQDLWDAVYRSGKLTIKLITQESGKQPVETDITSSFNLYTSPNRIAYENNGISDPSAANIKIQFVPSTVVVEKLGYKIIANFDNGVEVRNERNIQASDLSNVHWAALNDQRNNLFTLDLYQDASNENNKAVDVKYATKNGEETYRSVPVTGRTAKEVNEARRGSNFTIEGVRGFTDDNGDAVKGGNVEYPWIDLPYVEANVTVGYRDITNYTANLDESDIVISGVDANLEYYKKLIKERIAMTRPASHAIVTVSDTDGANAKVEETDRLDLRSPAFTINQNFTDRLIGGTFKHKVEFSPIVIEAFTGKFTVNFKPIEHTVTP